MCTGGGGGSRATIYMPKTDSYDRQFEMQKAAMEAQMRNNSMLMQQQLQSSLLRKQEMMDKITQMQVDKAQDPVAIDQMVDDRVETIMAAVQSLTPEPKDSEEPANRFAPNVQIGDVAREKGASRTSDVDRDRGGAKKSGKAGLRIRRNAQASGKGVGLSISSGD